MTRLRIAVFIVAASVALSPHPARSNDVFRWKDDQGRIHYSDHGPEGAEPTKLKVATAPAVHTVKAVFDGDTILLDNGERVRLLGINTPEADGPNKKGEPGGNEAKHWLRRRLMGRVVRLEQDKEPRDHYQRLLAHVFADNGEHINLTLVESGLAFLNLHPPNLKHAQVLIQAQNRAEQAKRGIWGMPDYQPRPVETLNVRPVLRGWQRLMGSPFAIVEKNRYLSLRFSDRFEVRVAKENLKLFPSLETYLHRRVEARGWLSQRRGRYSIFVRHPSALIVQK
ncbi:micrococcal nuclease [Methylocaldum szegediense]|jgi:micrococcal nuclease|uniref:Micrococcal nuclease n=2 Tax=Methylocaldum szegediense TaxID=73780 RepID=A0ABM9I0C8_9GAMM|nr:micrococcal nuclease [Methylocaldum szegediense]